MNKRNIVIALYQKDIRQSSRSHINSTLRKVLEGLVKYKPKAETKVAFVYGEQVVNVKEFQSLDIFSETFAEPVKKMADFEDIWLMSLALLEKEANFGTKNIFILVTDNYINERQAEQVLALPVLTRFQGLDVTLILIKGSSFTDEKLEAYIKKHGNVYFADEISFSSI